MKTEIIGIEVSGSEGGIEAIYRPAEVPRGLVLIHSATGVPQEYYQSFAEYLVGLDFSVLTYDYRGIGRSRPPSLRGFPVSISNWIDQDIPAVTSWAVEHFPDMPLLAIGHSVGGHGIVLSPSTNQLCGGVMIASHAGSSRTIMSRIERYRVRFLVEVLAPVLVSLIGYMPNKRLGLGENIPSEVMAQWRRWTMLPRYFLDDKDIAAEPRMADVRLPLLVMSFEDDLWANFQAVEMLLAPLTNAQIDRWHVGAEELGTFKVGHMGFFRKRHEHLLWLKVGEWLLLTCNRATGQMPKA
jgi:predicted alpha/beta hydrolase